MKKVKLFRFWSDSNQSTGTLVVFNNENQPIFINPCIERGWQDNQQNISCVPTGVYPLKLEYSNRFDMDLWELKDVPNRSECKIHAANYWSQLNGCIAPGEYLADINSDGYFDVTNSRNTLSSFHASLEGISETTIEIFDAY